MISSLEIVENLHQRTLAMEEMKFLFGNLIDTFNDGFKREEDRWNVLVMIGFTVLLTIGDDGGKK